jgi:hypothetical protein|tara:strand:- start:441 stop:752 length:312 start_codon:yes stop_codon:yes gene_type:complete
MPTLQATQDEAMAPGKKRVVARLSSCGCGCKGQDPHHRPTYRRVVRGLVIHADPRPYRGGYVEIGRGVVAIPGRGKQNALALAYNFENGQFGGLHWHLDDMRG